MNTEEDQPARDLREFRDQFVQTIGKQPPRRKLLRKRAAGALAGVLVVGGSAVAVAEVVNVPTPGDPPVLKKDTIIGFVNLETNELIRCPDGELLVKTKDREAKCDDGSVPDVFREQLAALELWSKDAEFGRPISSGPVFAVKLDE
jgi:hypothetical protein